MPAPSTIAVTAAGMIASGELFYHLMASLKREAVAFLFAASAIPLGIVMGWWRLVYNQVNPIMEILRPIPPLAWIPLSILWFGIGDEQNEFIIFLGIFFPILVNTIVGVKNIDPILIRAARSLGASERRLLARIVLIGALPQIITGVRIGLGVGWMALVAAELVGANSGLGFVINDARSMLRTDIIIVGMLTIGLDRIADRYRHPGAEPPAASLVPGNAQIGSCNGSAGGKRRIENLRGPSRRRAAWSRFAT